MSTAFDIEARTTTVEPRDHASLRYSWYVVVVLMMAYTLSFIDRQILSLLVEPMKAEMQLSDTQIGLLQGLAFAVFYTLLGLPMGWIVDRFSRRNLIVVGVTLWSIMTALCGVAGSFGTLFLARMGVGVGEATLSPASLSITTDYFPKERLGTALSVYSMGIFLGSGLAFLVGGAVVTTVADLPPIMIPLLGELSPWRLAFLIVGIPGLLVAALICTLREPRRTGVLKSDDGSVVALSFRQVGRELAVRWQSIAGIIGAMAFHAICMYGFFGWTPTFFIREHGWSAGQAGSALGVIVLLFGCGGMYAGGRLCDVWQAKGRASAPLRAALTGAITAGVALVLAFLVPNPTLSLALLAPAVFGLAMPIPSMFAALQLILPNQVRGQASALFLFAISLVGITLGPLMPGLLNDYLFRDTSRLGDSLALTMGVAAVGMVTVFRITYGPYAADYGRVHSDEAV